MSEITGRREVMRNLSLAAAGLVLASCVAPNASLETKKSIEEYPVHDVVATIFYIGEEASKDNAGIDNISTEWDNEAAKRFGGIDNPKRRDRNGLPRGFRPRHNPFYFALPASEFDEHGLIVGAREKAPKSWQAEAPYLDDDQSLFKGRWIKVTNPANGQEVYGQWLDTGPGEDPNSVQDYKYVFGTAEPAKPFGELRAALDVSPAMAHHLGFSMKEGGIAVDWQFVNEEDVPSMGPWRSRDFSPIDNYTYWDD